MPEGLFSRTLRDVRLPLNAGCQILCHRRLQLGAHLGVAVAVSLRPSLTTPVEAESVYLSEHTPR